MTGGSEARWWLSLLSGTFGSDGTLIMPREEPAPEMRDFMRTWGPDTWGPDIWGPDTWGPDASSGRGARWTPRSDGEGAAGRAAEAARTLSRAWPPCQCGGPKCRPDDEIPEVPGPDGSKESGS